MNRRANRNLWAILIISFFAIPIAMIYGTTSCSEQKLQVLMTYFTLLAVLTALFVEKLWNWVNEPNIEIVFDRNSERCSRWAIVPNCILQDEERTTDVIKYYFNLKITNYGGLAKKLRVRADIMGNNGTESERFEPTTLRWISRREETDLMRGESEYVNFLSQVVNHPEIDNRLSIEIFDKSPRGIAWDRPLDTYKYSIIIYGENIKPISKYIKFVPNKDKTKPGKLTLLKKLPE